MKDFCQTLPGLHLGSRKIKHASNIKLLLCIHDSELIWIRRMKYLEESCMRRLNVIKLLTNNSCGAEQKVILETHQHRFDLK
jgi:hypothetical protein